MTSFDLGVKCGSFISMKDGRAKVEHDVFLGIEAHTIRAITPFTVETIETLTRQCKTWIDATQMAVLPGLINGHTHLAMTLFRGLEDDLPLHRWLFERIFPLEVRILDPTTIRVGSELAALECIRFGVTTVCDMYYFAQVTADVWDRAGLRGLITQVFGDFAMPEDQMLGPDKVMLFNKLRERFGGHSRITPGLGPHAIFTSSDATLRSVAELAEKTSAPIHIHVAETKKEVEDCLRDHRKTPVQKLHEIGMLKKGTICAHAIHLNESDISTFAKSGASVAYNPDSNLKLGSGIAPIARYLREGIPVSFGTDGAASNNDLSIFGAMDVGTKLQKLAAGDNTAMIAEQALSCATWLGARALGLGDEIGSLEVGKRADLICVDLAHPHLKPLHNLVSHLVYSTQGLEVDTVVCDGKILMQNKQHTTLDPDAVYARLPEIQTRITKTLGALQ